MPRLHDHPFIHKKYRHPACHIFCWMTRPSPTGMAAMTTSPNTEVNDTVLVLVHGAWHGSWQWAATQRALAGLGAASLAVDMPGHGFDVPLPSGYLLPGQPGLLTEKSQLAAVTMDDCADAVLDTLRRVRRYGRVVLVAHSAGGGPASLAAERAPSWSTASSTSPRSSPPAAPGSSTTSAPPRTPPHRDRASTSVIPGHWAPYASTRSRRTPLTSRSYGRPTTTTRPPAASTAGAPRSAPTCHWPSRLPRSP